SLTRRGDRLGVREVLAGDCVELEIYPLVVRAFFDAFELQTEADETLRLDRQCSELVRDVHRTLTTARSGETVTRAEQMSDRYILGLEQRIDELATARDDLPRDDMNRTALGDHLAGVAVRSALIHRLIERSGEKVGSFKNPRETGQWGRLQTGLPDSEAELDRLVTVGQRQLGLEGIADPTAPIQSGEEEFWPH